jgi:hypothetical protein
MGKSCLHFKLLAALGKTILEQLIANSVLEVTRRDGKQRREDVAEPHCAISLRR